MDLDKLQIFVKDSVPAEFQRWVGKPCKVVKIFAAEPRYQIECPDGKRTYVYSKEVAKLLTETDFQYTVVKLLQSGGLSSELEPFDTPEEACAKAEELNGKRKAWTPYTWIVLTEPKQDSFKE